MNALKLSLEKTYLPMSSDISHSQAYNNKLSGFTLIELSIVLVIIGLIVGGILVGQDLIKAAEIRSTVGQIEKYNSAVNTFRTKYNGIPGDITSTSATAFGLFAETTLAGNAGHQDGNGLVEGGGTGATSAIGETLDFWRHLSDASLIDGNFGTTGNSLILAASGLPTGAVTTMSQSVPTSKTTPANYFAVYSVSGLNYYELGPWSGITGAGAYTFGTAGLSPIQAYNMDVKLDDGLPQTGIVISKGISAINANPSSNAASTALTCDLGAGTATDNYNRVAATGGNDPSCAVQFRFN